MAISKKQIDKALPEGYEIHKGQGYCWFSGPGTEQWYSTSVYTPAYNQLPVEDWVSAFNDLKERWEARVSECSLSEDLYENRLKLS